MQKKKQDNSIRYEPVNAQFKDLSKSPVKKAQPVQSLTKQAHKNPVNKSNTNNRRGSDEFPTYFKSGSHVIDTDSISLGSLSESPPSEFKFSDEECDESDAENIAAIKAANNFNHNSTKGLRKDADFPHVRTAKPKNSITEVINQETTAKQQNLLQNSTQIAELNKNIQQQQMKLNQLELLRNRKKNFHSILLKDAKCKF